MQAGLSEVSTEIQEAGLTRLYLLEKSFRTDNQMGGVSEALNQMVRKLNQNLRNWNQKVK